MEQRPHLSFGGDEHSAPNDHLAADALRASTGEEAGDGAGAGVVPAGAGDETGGGSTALRELPEVVVGFLVAGHGYLPSSTLRSNSFVASAWLLKGLQP